MAQIANPRKKFNFTIEVVGFPFDPFLAQKVTIPEREIEVVEHGDTNHDIKTAGRNKYGMIRIEKIMTTTGSDTFFEDWMSQAQNVILGGGLTPQAYKRILTISELAEDGQSLINQWICTGVWPSRRDEIDLDRNESDNTIESVELCVDVIEKI